MVLSMDRWKNQIAIVTGASVGIGAAIAEKLVEEGLQVVGLARRSEKIEELAKKLSGKAGCLHAVKADMSEEEDILKAFKWVSDNLGPVSILINNAGILHQTNLVEGDAKKWKNVFDVNVIGLSIATREAIKIMRENKINGHVIHINSVLGHRVVYNPFSNVYPASKYAITALTETLRQELNHLGLKIKITSLSPGVVDTEITETNNWILDEETFKARNNRAKLKCEDIADGVVYVLSTPPHVQIHELTIKPMGEVF